MINKSHIKNIKVASFAVLALCFCSLLVFLTEQNTPKALTIQEKALERAQIYAQRLIDSKFKAESGSVPVGRTLASTNGSAREVLEGPVGLDPWGHAFNFKVNKSPNNPNEGVVVIWSGGPNNKLETTSDMIAKDSDTFAGDDFGKSYSFSF